MDIFDQVTDQDDLNHSQKFNYHSHESALLHNSISRVYILRPTLSSETRLQQWKWPLHISTCMFHKRFKLNRSATELNLGLRLVFTNLLDGIIIYPTAQAWEAGSLPLFHP